MSDTIVKSLRDTCRNCNYGQQAANTLQASQQTFKELVEVLEECVDFFSDRADCDQPSGSGPIPNAEMYLLVTAKRILKKVERAKI